MQVQAYLIFNGRSDEALAFYERALGAKVLLLVRFKDAPPNPQHPADPALADKVMHASFQIGDSILMCSDGDCNPGGGRHEGYSLSLDPATVEEGQKLFDALLADGGEIAMPFQKTFWALGFGMLKDRFGVHWMVNVADPAMQG
jgi:PhnB protein